MKKILIALVAIAFLASPALAAETEPQPADPSAKAAKKTSVQEEPIPHFAKKKAKKKTKKKTKKAMSPPKSDSGMAAPAASAPK